MAIAGLSILHSGSQCSYVQAVIIAMINSERRYIIPRSTSGVPPTTPTLHNPTTCGLYLSIQIIISLPSCMPYLHLARLTHAICNSITASLSMHSSTPAIKSPFLNYFARGDFPYFGCSGDRHCKSSLLGQIEACTTACRCHLFLELLNFGCVQESLVLHRFCLGIPKSAEEPAGNY